VLLIVDGRVVLDMPWEAAKELTKAITIQALKSEEIANREQIIFDDALALRAGLPFGLARLPVLRREAEREAQYNRTLRRFMPGGVKSKEHVGTPTILLGVPKREVK